MNQTRRVSWVYIKALAAAVVLVFEVPELIRDPSSLGQWLYVLVGVLLVTSAGIDFVRQRPGPS